MTGIVEMFAALSEPDEFDEAYQLELFAWKERASRRESHAFRQRWYRKTGAVKESAERKEYRRKWMLSKRRNTPRSAYAKANHCGRCGERGHNARTCAMQVAA